MSLSADSSTERTTPVMTDLQDVAAMVAVNEGATVSRTVMPGDVIHFGTRLPHAVRALEPSKLALYMLDKREKPQQ